MHTARTRRRKADDLILAVASPQRFAELQLITSKIAFSNQSSVCLHPLTGRDRKGSFIKPVAPLLRQRGVAGRQFRLLQDISILPGLASVLKENQSTGWKLLQLAGDAGQPPGIGAVELETFLRQIFRRKHYLFPA